MAPLSVSITERSDLNCIIPDRECITSDLGAFDVYVQELETTVIRGPHDKPFNKDFWEKVRVGLAQAGPVGFQALEEEGACQLKTSQDAGKVFARCDKFRWLMPIFPNMAAEETGHSLQNVLTELLYATTIGLVEMVWAPDCDRCNGSVCQLTTLSDLRSNATCGGCGHENTITCMDRVKVYFIFNSDVFYLPLHNFECPHAYLPMSRLIFCGCVFPTVTKSGFGYMFGVDSQESQPLLQKGDYRIFCPYSNVDAILTVQDDASEHDKVIRTSLKVSDMQRAEVGMVCKTITIAHGRVRLDFFCDTKSVFIPFLFRGEGSVFERDRLDDDLRKPYTPATELLHHPSFKPLFQSQIISDSSKFTFQRVVLVFTDVVGSTALYECLGDGSALDTVKEHFKILFQAFALSGRVVKTVGDSVMAAFTSGEAAICAVAQAIMDIDSKCHLPNCSTSLEIRVGMHCGPAVMVPLNGINDYFGSTVNIAARVESKASAQECLVTEEVLAMPGAAQAFDKVLHRGFIHSRDAELSLKGVSRDVRAKGFMIDPDLC